MNMEVLECARYGEDDDLKALLEAGADANYADESGSTGLHKAAANGQEGCLRILHSFGAKYVKNSTGNTPAHWAAQNAKNGALKFIIDNYEVDVLTKNDLGRSILTEAFQSKSTECIELCLSHDSASEERLINPDKARKTKEENAAAEANTEMETDDQNEAENAEAHAVTHTMQFGADVVVKVRELPITRADNPFGTDTAPEDDTTGLSVWPASILLSQWVAAKWGRASGRDMSSKMILELGAGCGLPAIVAAHACHPKVVYVSDIHEPTLLNAAFNVQLNAEVKPAEATAGTYYCTGSIAHPNHSGLQQNTTTPTNNNTTTQLSVIKMNWLDTDTYPLEKADLILGSDLVYDASILTCLVPAICSMLSPDGSLLYCAPDTGRHGMAGLEEALSRVGVACVEKFPAPEEFYVNPLRDVEGDEFVLHFYDLSAKQAHTMYHFQWHQQQEQQQQQHEQAAVSEDSTAMETY